MKLPFISRKYVEKEISDLKGKLHKAKAALEKSKIKIEALSENRKGANELQDVLRQINGTQDRRLLLSRILRGEGIEIGALHHPLPTQAGVKVRYVDYKSRE